MAAPRNGRNVVSRKMSIWVGHYEPLELFCLWTKVHQFSFAQRGEGVVADQVFLRCSICRSIPEIFAMKLESCQKSRRNLDVFLALGNFGGRTFQKLYTRYHQDTHISPKVIEARTLNFKPNFKFSRLKLFGGVPPSQLGCALGSLGQSVARLKISGRSTP